MISTPLSIISNDWEIDDDDEMQRIEACRRILLNAGADPTLASEEAETLLNQAVTGGALVCTKLVIVL